MKLLRINSLGIRHYLILLHADSSSFLHSCVLYRAFYTCRIFSSFLSLFLLSFLVTMADRDLPQVSSSLASILS